MVELALAEKGLEFAVRELSFAKGEHRTPEMLALNPRGTIPVLCVGEAVLYESLAMLEYIDLCYPEPPLLGTDRLGRARALNRLHESAGLKSAGMRLFAYLMRTPESERDGALVAGMRDDFRAELGWWERYYDGDTWAAGPALSMADLSVFVYVATASRLGLALDPDFPRVRAMFAQMRRRPSVEATWPWQEEADCTPLAVEA